MKKNKIILLIVVIFWMGIIFAFSNQNAKNSQNLSDKVTSKIIDVSCKILKKEITTERKLELIKKVRFFIRKTAHFSLYFVLAILTFILLDKFEVKSKILFTFLLCFFYACSDELHQLFINERTAKILDVLIDMVGSFFGLGVYLLLRKVNKEKTKDDIIIKKKMEVKK